MNTSGNWGKLAPCSHRGANSVLTFIKEMLNPPASALYRWGRTPTATSPWRSQRDPAIPTAETASHVRAEMPTGSQAGWGTASRTSRSAQIPVPSCPPGSSLHRSIHRPSPTQSTQVELWGRRFAICMTWISFERWKHLAHDYKNLKAMKRGLHSPYWTAATCGKGNPHPSPHPGHGLKKQPNDWTRSQWFVERGFFCWLRDTEVTFITWTRSS